MVRPTHPKHTTAGAALTCLVLASAVLAGCSGRDTAAAEKIAAMEQLAVRAEKAADRAEAAAKKAAGAQPATVIEVEPEDPSQTEAAAAEGEGDGSEPTTR
jgi:hypothetical protein